MTSLAQPLEGAAIRRAGSDVSLITYGGSLKKVLAAADELAKEGIACEVIDLFCLAWNLSVFIICH